MRIKSFLRRHVRNLGWDIRRFNSQNSEWSRLVQQLRVHEVDVVFDVGANIGQFAQNLRDSGFTGRIVSFEAASAEYRKLRERARRDPRWTVAPQAALGDREGTILFHIAGNSASSSALPMLMAHVSADPKSAYVASEIVELHTLDSLGTPFLSHSDRLFLKLDVQGFEHNVLRGAPELLGRALGIQLELSLVPLYEGEHLFSQMLDELRATGFELWSMVPGFVDPQSGRLLQLDAVLFRDTIDHANSAGAFDVKVAIGNERHSPPRLNV